MLTITRKTARMVRAVFRRALALTGGGFTPPVVLEASASGLDIRAATALAAEIEGAERDRRRRP